MSDKNEKKDFRTSIGGQALIEGILMRGPKKQAMVVRTKDGLVTKVEDLKLLKEKYPIVGWPLIRGVVNFISSMANGVRALMFSAECMPEDEQEEESKFEKWIEKRVGKKKAESALVTFSMILGVALSVGLFILLPTFLAGAFFGLIQSAILKNLLEGALRVIIFIAYLWLATRLDDMKRVWAYHGAEHKTIFCYEAGLPLTVENVKSQKKEHPRCGTSFLFVVMIISIVIFSFTSWTNPWVRMGFRLLLLPVVVAISYEINRLVGRYDNFFTRFLRAPGVLLQKMTTFEPDDSMIEVAIEALEKVIPEDETTDKW